MRHTRLWILATIIACIILVGFVLSVPHTARDTAPATTVTNEQTIPVVSIRDSYKKGTHTINGSVRAPDACTTLSAVATPEGAASSTASILVDVTMSESTGVCLERATTLTFSTKVSAPAGTPLSVRVNGTLASTTPL